MMQIKERRKMMKQKGLLSLVLLLLFLGGTTQCLADENQAEYKSNGVTGFYGTYEYSTDSTTEPSTTTESSLEPDKKEPKTNLNHEVSEQQSLPKTGDRSSNRWLYIGILVLVLLFLLLIYKRRKEEEK